MSKVSYEPNNTKNGHLGAKLAPIENRKFPKNRFHTPNYGRSIAWETRMYLKWSACVVEWSLVATFGIGENNTFIQSQYIRIFLRLQRYFPLYSNSTKKILVCAAN